MREVIYIDIANDSVSRQDYKPDEDPTRFHSEKTGRGPLGGTWMVRGHLSFTCITKYFTNNIPKL